MFQLIDDDTKRFLKKRLSDLQTENRELASDVKTIDLDFYERLDITIARKKRELKSKRSDINNQININALAIVEIERTLYDGGYNIRDSEPENKKTELEGE